jgi:hypothetical protein
VRVAYVDDGGDVQTLVASNPNVPPVLVFGGVAINADSLPQLTRDFLGLKRRFFPRKMTSPHLLDDIKVEVKGADLRTMVRGNHRSRRHALQFFHELLVLLEGNDAQVFGRVWVKQLNTPLSGHSVNAYSIQSMCKTFQHLLDEVNDYGLMVIDSSTPGLNATVSH